jgi:hypothetical protein
VPIRAIRGSKQKRPLNFRPEGAKTFLPSLYGTTGATTFTSTRPPSCGELLVVCAGIAPTAGN